MGRLVPLRLPEKVARPLPEPPTRGPPAPPPSPITPPSPTPPPVPERSPRRPMRVLSEEMPPSLPKSQTEWRQLLDEVRTLYLKGHYRQCSARCTQVLEDAPAPLPVHSLYISFYAAISLELTAKPLAPTSPQKSLLFQLARFHYQKAEYHLARFHYQKAEYHLADASIEDHSPKPDDRSRQPSISSASSVSSAHFKRSSIDSSTESLFSHDHSSALPSPTTSVCSSSASSTYQDDTIMTPRPLNVRRRVFFRPSLPTVPSVPAITIVSSPKTPCHKHCNALTLAAIRTALAESPSATSECSFSSRVRSCAGSDDSVGSFTIPVPKYDYVSISNPSSSPSPCPLFASNPSPTLSAAEPLLATEAESADTVLAVLLSRSITRYNAHLASMATQLTYHISVLEKLIQDLPSASSFPSTAITSIAAVDNEPYGSKFRAHFESLKGRAATNSERGMKEEGREMLAEEKKRMRKKRMEEWERMERFDGGRWEDLAEKSLRELDMDFHR